ncbi:MAG: AzlD domain-containing protein [Sphaerochaetaceae bacterium]|jgi:branched-subunit amino acid transport protein AzlD|nr:AzlD domain-containing protein [Sphaerochaetaceae bacterium]
MSTIERLATIALVILGTQLTRHLSFWIFSKNNEPSWVKYLGKALCPAIFGFLLVYSLKGYGSTAWQAAAALGVTALLHIFKRQMLLSIAGGTLCYMLLVNLIG